MVVPGANQFRHAECLNGAVVLNSGAQWHMLPQCYPKLQNGAPSFRGVVPQLGTAWGSDDIANELRVRGALDEEECFIDATFAMAKGGGAEMAPTKRGKGMKSWQLWIATACRSRSARMRRTIMRCASFNYASIST
jgi:hypothetical protein